MSEGERGFLATNFNRDEWGTILDPDFGKQDTRARDFLIGLRINGNRPLPLPLGFDPRLVLAINKKIIEEGFELVQVKPDPFSKGPRLQTYQIVRVKKEP